MLLYSCVVVLLCCFTEGCTQNLSLFATFSVSINFGTLDNHILLSHYKFHENRRRTIEVILNVVAMFIVGVREN